MTKLGEAKPGHNLRLILEDRGLIHPVPVFCSICLFFGEPDQDSMDSERREDGMFCAIERYLGGGFHDLFLHSASVDLRPQVSAKLRQH
jgi:hypothetical protein